MASLIYIDGHPETFDAELWGFRGGISSAMVLITDC